MRGCSSKLAWMASTHSANAPGAPSRSFTTAITSRCCAIILRKCLHWVWVTASRRRDAARSRTAASPMSRRTAMQSYTGSPGSSSAAAASRTIRSSSSARPGLSPRASDLTDRTCSLVSARSLTVAALTILSNSVQYISATFVRQCISSNPARTSCKRDMTTSATPRVRQWLRDTATRASKSDAWRKQEVARGKSNEVAALMAEYA
mmetsp:Transcript_41763/g.116449  ORF Transcript_41763/g.116449 Transcript_41763/m.116449 type:complete len:206 (+) Transcript_41763:815-1432(+)